MSETKINYRLKGRASYLLAASTIIYARELRKRGLGHLLDQWPEIFSEIRGYSYNCFVGWLTEMIVDGFIDIAVDPRNGDILLWLKNIF